MPKIALLQSKTFPTKDQALQHHIQLIEQAAAKGASIISTQELFLTPYFCTTQDTEHFQLADPLDAPLTQTLGDLARRLGIVLIASHFEQRGPGLYHNTALIFDSHHGLLGHYRKSHIPQDPGFEEKFYFTPGDSNYPVWETSQGTIGVLICWDQWYPEAARLMALAGAQILIYPTAIGWLPEEKDQPIEPTADHTDNQPSTLGQAQHNAWERVQCGHAVANGCYLAAINRVGQEGETQFWGQSFLANPYGQVLKRGSIDQEEIITHQLDYTQVEEFRRIWPFFRDRRIDSYHDLTQRWRK